MCLQRCAMLCRAVCCPCPASPAHPCEPLCEGLPCQTAITIIVPGMLCNTVRRTTQVVAAQHTLVCCAVPCYAVLCVILAQHTSSLLTRVNHSVKASLLSNSCGMMKWSNAHNSCARGGIAAAGEGIPAAGGGIAAAPTKTLSSAFVSPLKSKSAVKQLGHDGVEQRPQLLCRGEGSQKSSSSSSSSCYVLSDPHRSSPYCVHASVGTILRLHWTGL